VSEILTREEFEAQFERANGVLAEQALRAHDAALRADVVELERAVDSRIKQRDAAEARVVELEKERDSQESRVKRISLAQFMAVEDRVKQLEKVIEDAPHEFMCASESRKPCDCWKARAAKKEGEK
jgi:hypothetical protein